MRGALRPRGGRGVGQVVGLGDGQPEPAVIVTTNSQMGASPYTTTLEGIIFPFVQSHYHVSTNRWRPDYAQAGAYEATFTAGDGTKSYSLSTVETVTVTVGDVTVCEQLSGLQSAIAGLNVNGVVKNALRVKLEKAADPVGKGQTADAVGLLSTDFIGQVHGLLSEGKLTEGHATSLTIPAQEAIQSILS
jgi:hypothetical protein